MPVRDPNKIDAAEAIRIYNVWRDWVLVASIMTRPNGQPYKAVSIFNAVRRHDLQAAE